MYKLFEGFDHFNNIPIYQVVGDVYIGEWHTEKSDAEDELKKMNQ